MIRPSGACNSFSAKGREERYGSKVTSAILLACRNKIIDAARANTACRLRSSQPPSAPKAHAPAATASGVFRYAKDRNVRSPCGRERVCIRLGAAAALRKCRLLRECGAPDKEWCKSWQNQRHRCYPEPLL